MLQLGEEFFGVQVRVRGVIVGERDVDRGRERESGNWILRTK